MTQSIRFGNQDLEIRSDASSFTVLKYKELFSMHVVKQLLKNHYFYEKLLEVLAACA